MFHVEHSRIFEFHQPVAQFLGPSQLRMFHVTNRDRAYKPREDVTRRLNKALRVGPNVVFSL